MMLEEIDVSMLRRAMEIYVVHAYADAPRPRCAEIEPGTTVTEVIARFVDETGPDGEESSRRFALRLGNRRYPFMKIILQEYLLKNQFFLMVDTHDQMEIRPGMPDYDAWQDLRSFNRGLKSKIECAWEAASLPTLSDLKKIVEEVPVGRPVEGRDRILIVDDEKPLADSLGALLRRKGYRVETAYDGSAALDRVQESKPDLILMDYEMPRLDGIQLCHRLRAHAETEDIPVLLTTASSVDLQEVMKLANGFLVKPYQKEILFDFIDHLIH